MTKLLDAAELIEFGVSANIAAALASKINQLLQIGSPELSWKKISREVLSPNLPFKLHLKLFSLAYPEWRERPCTAPAWIPQKDEIALTNLAKFMTEVGIKSLSAFHQWTTEKHDEFLNKIIKQLNIKFHTAPKQITDFSQGVENPHWLVGAKMNIVDSCFNAPPEKIALIYQSSKHSLQKMTYAELDKLSNRIANSLIERGFAPHEAIAINMPMNMNAVAIYLGIIKMGGIVVSIADSFSPEEIATRLKIANTKAIFTQDTIYRDNKTLPLYTKVISAHAPSAIVLSESKMTTQLRAQDITWEDFLKDDDQFVSCTCDPMTYCNILFSSGTTGTPKAIPWNHTTGIKVASDAFFHHDICSSDIAAWPTNLGWMMGPWLIFASLINHAAIALYDDVPRNAQFGKFIQDAKVTILGVVPTLVASWRQTQCMENLNWNSIRLFSSSGECSNPEDMLYLMSLANYKPIIEYCGGTEIGGAYISSTLIEKNYPAIFTTPVMGIDFLILDENGRISDNGEVAIIPPALGLSTELINANHHDTYFVDMPTPRGKILRRHGDQLHRFSQHCYCVLGRVDDTMNLGGIKVSSAEIERTLIGIEGIIESAAIAITPANHGPSLLVIFAATQNQLIKEDIIKIMQTRINQHLNPLFKIHDVVFLTELPKTASNKIMRRVLRNKFN